MPMVGHGVKRKDCLYYKIINMTSLGETWMPLMTVLLLPINICQKADAQVNVYVSGYTVFTLLDLDDHIYLYVELQG